MTGRFLVMFLHNVAVSFRTGQVVPQTALPRVHFHGESFSAKRINIDSDLFRHPGLRRKCRAKRIGSLRFKVLHCCRWLSRENEVEEVKNEGPKEMTLDEWKAMQDKERTKVEFNIRKPNEGADSQWKKGYVLHKSKSEDVSVAINNVT